VAFKTGGIIGSTALVAALIWNVPAAHAGSPSFNCAKADSRAEELICGDKELAIMDVEATRVFRLVRDREGMADEQRKALNDDRARWMKVRDECWIAEDFRSCILSAYAIRIHSLRENHSDVLAGDDKGITRGPVALTCDKLGDTVSATFIRSDPPVSAVQFHKRVHVGIGTGPRYIEKTASGELAFWTKGDLAYLTTPDGVNYSCTLEKAK
jgi:uncharacterized protein